MKINSLYKIEVGRDVVYFSNNKTDMVVSGLIIENDSFYLLSSFVDEQNCLNMKIVSKYGLGYIYYSCKEISGTYEDFYKII